MTRPFFPETRGIYFELVRHFFARLFDSEMFSTRGQWQSVAIAAFSLAAPAGLLLLDPPYLPHRTLPSSAPDELAVLTLLFSITGVLALLSWQSLFPTRRDFLALASFPATPWQIFVARFASILLFAATLVVTITILPSLMPPHYFTAPSDHTGAIARAIPAILGCLFIFFAIVSLQGILLNILPARYFTQISTYIQGALVAVFFLAGLYSWFIVKWTPEMLARLPEFAWAPPIWFAGLCRFLSDPRDPFNSAMAARATTAVVAALALSVATYLLSYRRYRKLLIESTGASHHPAWRLEWTRNPQQAAILRFIVTTLSRSRTHRLVLMVYFGAALGILINGVLLAGAATGWRAGTQGSLQFGALYWPLETSFIMLSGMRHVFSLPADLPSNWIFQITESQGRRDWMRAVERFSIVYIILPIYVIGTPIAASALGWSVALRMAVLQFVVSLITFDLLFYDWQQLPFACSYAPGKKSLMSLVASWLAVLGVITPFLSIVISTVARMPELFLIYGAFFVGDWIWARKRRLEGWGETRLLYQDPFGQILSLGIKDMTWRNTALAEEPPHHEPPQFPDPRNPRNPLLRRLKLIFHRAQLDRDLDDELQFHLDMTSQRQFGNLALVKEECRSQWTFPSIETLWQDLRYGARQLRRAPAVTAVAALTLSLGIGAATAVYSMCDAVLWRPVAVPHPERFAMVLQALPGDTHLWSASSPADIADIRSSATSIESLTSWSYGSVNLVAVDGEPARVEQVRVRPNFFDVLGAPPAMGHGFQTNDREVILSDGCWRRRFGADPEILGTSIWLDNRKFTVVGVMPPSFGFPRVSYELWTPLELTPSQEHSREALMLDSIARLKPGRTLRDTSAELDTIARRLENTWPDTHKNRRFLARSVQRFWTGDYSLQYSRMLLGASLLVLLICCANVASLQLARSTLRGRELAIRAALGARPVRLIRQLITESLLVAAVGAALGLLASDWALHIIKAGVPGEMRQYMPGWADIGLNPRALLFALGAALLSGIIAGLAPGWRTARQDLTGALQDGGNAASSGRARRTIRNILVVAEIAVATVLVLGAGLMVRSFRESLNSRTRIDPSTLLTLRLFPRDTEFYTEVLTRIGAIPGVRSVAAVSTLPYSRRLIVRTFDIDGRPQQKSDRPHAQVQSVSAGYFETLHIPLQSGRLLQPADGPETLRVAVISRAAARRWWRIPEPQTRWTGETSPIGRRIRIGPESSPWITIVGIVDDTESSALNRTPQPVFYLPAVQSGEREMDIAIRTSIAPMRIAPDVRAAIRSIDARQPITNLNTMAELIHQEAFGLAYIAALMGVFGALALGLSFVGVYGLMSCLVSEQVREIGVRTALGASPQNIIVHFCRDGIRKAAMGLSIGLVLAVGLERLMRATMLGVAEDTPLVLLSMPLVLAAAVAIAVYIPARKATRIHPVDALRC